MMMIQPPNIRWDFVWVHKQSPFPIRAYVSVPVSELAISL
jgi:hypothetical protein